MVREAWVRALAGGIANDVHWPSQQELSDTIGCCADWRVTDGFPHLSHDFVRYIDSERVVGGGVQWGQAELGTGLWDEDLVKVHVTCAGMMPGVADSPGVVRDAKTIG